VTRPYRWFTTEPDAYGRRAVWIAWVVAMVGAAAVYAGKADDGGSAFIRWRHQVVDFWRGANIWDKYYFPNPPIFPITLTPFMWLPEVPGALAWFTFKVGLTTVAILLCFRMVNASGKTLPSYVQGLALILSFRPILSDLHHGNNNLLIMSLVVFSLYAWRKGYDVLAGLILALAITYKVTPALFVPYFMYKRSWRTVGATAIGIGLFLLIVPSAVMGPGFNGQCLAMWWHRILSPFVAGDVVSVQEVNQSMVGTLMRLLTPAKGVDDHGYGGTHYVGNLVALTPRTAVLIVKGVSLLFIGLLAFCCRTQANRRDDARLMGEFSLVVLVMLFVSERSWKHHFVTLLLPYTYLAYRALVPPTTKAVRFGIGAALFASALLIATTSAEVGGLVTIHQVSARGAPSARPGRSERVARATRGPDPASTAARNGPREPVRRVTGIKGHKVAQFYGMFFWSGLVLFIATAWRVRADAKFAVDPAEPTTREVPAPHWVQVRDAADRLELI
jgi:alpha-1,2-mannosyltransferase